MHTLCSRFHSLEMLDTIHSIKKCFFLFFLSKKLLTNQLIVRSSHFSFLVTKLWKYKNVTWSLYTFYKKRWARQKKTERKSCNQSDLNTKNQKMKIGDERNIKNSKEMFLFLFWFLLLTQLKNKRQPAGTWLHFFRIAEKAKKIRQINLVFF